MGYGCLGCRRLLGNSAAQCRGGGSQGGEGCRQPLARLSAQLSSAAAELTTAALLKEPKRARGFCRKVLSSRGESDEKVPRKAANVCSTTCGSLRVAEEYVSSQYG